ncbi:hypothetical protein GCM10017600_67030 [Streptosporangium carneum]|uniref:ABC transporter domain-containing protein n=1 Tax=Streptosporangium carneum TaxID=47481 RepID=A0A9W6I708_9ACTN|nr:hypothetical protein GCM10017600_67030 [Streptosporangium carneum]
MLSFTEVTCRFGSVRALDPVTPTVGRGEFVSVIGPSGCGNYGLKRMQTLIDLIGEYAPDADIIPGDLVTNQFIDPSIGLKP